MGEYTFIRDVSDLEDLRNYHSDTLDKIRRLEGSLGVQRNRLRGYTHEAFEYIDSDKANEFTREIRERGQAEMRLIEEHADTCKNVIPMPLF